LNSKRPLSSKPILMFTPVEKVIPEKNIVILSPHYDDVLLTFGGYLNSARKSGLLETKTIAIVLVFSRTIYQQGEDKTGNRDKSLKRIQFATGVRLLEDLNCMDKLLGFGNYDYRVWAEKECLLRGTVWKKGEKFDFPFGNRNTYTKKDLETHKRLIIRIKTFLIHSNTAVLTTTGIKEHVDHSLVRDAVIDAKKELGHKAIATVYFGEEQPYSGLANKKDRSVCDQFIDELALKKIDFLINSKEKATLLMTAYPSQVTPAYKEGILKRSKQLLQTQKSNLKKTGAERIYKW